jgi:hypothetical protein
VGAGTERETCRRRCEWRQPLLSDRFASAVPAPLGSSCHGKPAPRVNAGNPPSQPPEDPSVRPVWDLPQSVWSQTLLRDNPSLESGRTSLGASSHSSTPEPPSRTCPCIAHAAGKSIPPSPSLIPFCHQASLSWKSHFCPACFLPFHPFLSPPGLASVTFFTPLCSASSDAATSIRLLVLCGID